MGDTLSVSIDTSKDAAQPTLEEEAAKYDNPPPADDRPEWLPEKFKSPEDMAKAYGELEKRFSSRTKETPVEETDSVEEDNSTKGADETEEKSPEEQARQVTKEAGLDFDELSATYWETGELAEAQYTKLEKAGIPKTVVDQFIAGQEALLSATRQSVFNTVGGEEAYNSMTEWAAENFSKDEIKAYNDAVNSGNTANAMMAVKGLKAQYEAVVGFEPARQVKGSNATPSASTYRSVAELEKDMGDPRYKTDSAFRKDVERKLSRSDLF
jgi:hypothetical protein